jgi:hypothetical protein
VLGCFSLQYTRLCQQAFEENLRAGAWLIWESTWLARIKKPVPSKKKKGKLELLAFERGI